MNYCYRILLAIILMVSPLSGMEQQGDKTSKAHTMKNSDVNDKLPCAKTLKKIMIRLESEFEQQHLNSDDHGLLLGNCVGILLLSMRKFFEDEN